MHLQNLTRPTLVQVGVITNGAGVGGGAIYFTLFTKFLGMRELLLMKWYQLVWHAVFEDGSHCSLNKQAWNSLENKDVQHTLRLITASENWWNDSFDRRIPSGARDVLFTHVPRPWCVAAFANVYRTQQPEFWASLYYTVKAIFPGQPSTLTSSSLHQKGSSEG